MSPERIAKDLLSYLRQELPLGSTTAEERFLRLYSLILKRVFGPIEPPPYTNPLCSLCSRPFEYFHEWGGWLSRVDRWSTSFEFNHIGSTQHDPVFELLSRNLIDPIDHETKYRPQISFTLPFTALPKRI